MLLLLHQAVAGERPPGGLTWHTVNGNEYGFEKNSAPIEWESPPERLSTESIECREVESCQIQREVRKRKEYTHNVELSVDSEFD